MQRFHLLGSNEVWTSERLQRLMDVMAKPSEAESSVGEPASDKVLLRCSPGYMTIDVFFVDSDVASVVTKCNRHAMEQQKEETAAKQQMSDLLAQNDKFLNMAEKFTEG